MPSETSKHKNDPLHKAKQEKNDEFYTQLTDIEKEILHYKPYFEGKVVYCNCDDPRVSNFFKFFAMQFENYKLKKLITTCYKNQDWDLFSKKESEKAIQIIYKGDMDGNNRPDYDEMIKRELKGDGDFRSSECVELLKEADIVVTNPPFSLFREYVAQLMEYDKKFIIIGNMNAISYKEIFPLIKENKVWLGVNPRSMTFKDYEGNESVVNACWFTNLPHRRRNESIESLYRYYEGEEDYFPKYDNYDAIEVSKVRDIPLDYKGVMGVPISFLDKWNPEQFEIVGLLADNRIEDEPSFLQGAPTYTDERHKKSVCGVLNGKRVYPRIIIKHKHPQSRSERAAEIKRLLGEE